MSKNKTKMILLIECDQDRCQVIASTLKKDGFRTMAFHTGQQVIPYVEKHNIDLILLDLIMPKMDGFQILEEMRKRNISIPVIVVSDLSHQDDIERAYGLGVKEYYKKSDLDINLVAKKIHDCIGCDQTPNKVNGDVLYSSQ